MTGLDDDEETNLTALNLDLENDDEEEEEDDEEEEELDQEKMLDDTSDDEEEEEEADGLEIVDELEELDRLEREMHREEKPAMLNDMMLDE